MHYIPLYNVQHVFACKPVAYKCWSCKNIKNYTLKVWTEHIMIVVSHFLFLTFRMCFFQIFINLWHSTCWERIEHQTSLCLFWLLSKHKPFHLSTPINCVELHVSCCLSPFMIFPGIKVIWSTLPKSATSCLGLTLPWPRMVSPLEIHLGIYSVLTTQSESSVMNKVVRLQVVVCLRYINTCIYTWV